MQSQIFWSNEHQESDSALIWCRLLTGAEVRDNLILAFINPTIAAMTSFVGCLCTVMFTPACSWRGNVLSFINLRLQRGERAKVERKLESLVISEVDLNSNSQTCKPSVFDVACELFRHMYSKVIWLFEMNKHRTNTQLVLLVVSQHTFLIKNSANLSFV